MAQNTALTAQRCNGAGRTKVCGRFLAGTYNKDYASYVLDVTAAGSNILIYALDKGKSLGYKFTSVADGSAKASVDLSTKTTHIDSIVSAASAGTAANAATVRILGADLGTGATTCFILKDTALELIVLCNINAGAGQSTVADFETAVNTSTYFDAASGSGASLITSADCLGPFTLAGGTAGQWAAWSTDTLTLHFTDATTTVAQAITAINAASSSRVTAVATSATTTNVLAATTDEVTAAALIGGETIGKGFNPSRTDVGSYTITTDDYHSLLVTAHFNKIVATADALRVVGQALAPDTKSLQCKVLNSSSAATELTAGDYVTFNAILATYSTK